jgi:hypothetical protein
MTGKRLESGASFLTGEAPTLETGASSFADGGAGAGVRSVKRGGVLNGIAFSIRTLKSWQIRRHGQQARRNHDAGRRCEVIRRFGGPVRSHMGPRPPNASTPTFVAKALLFFPAASHRMLCILIAGALQAASSRERSPQRAPAFACLGAEMVILSKAFAIAGLVTILAILTILSLAPAMLQ